MHWYIVKVAKKYMYAVHMNRQYYFDILIFMLTWKYGDLKLQQFGS